MDCFRACFADLQDPRRARALWHDLDEIVMATASDAATCVGMVPFGRSKQALLRRFMRQSGGIPSDDTLLPVLQLLDPGVFDDCVARHVAGPAERMAGSGGGGVAAADGKQKDASRAHPAAARRSGCRVRRPGTNGRRRPRPCALPTSTAPIGTSSTTRTKFRLDSFRSVVMGEDTSAASATTTARRAASPSAWSETMRSARAPRRRLTRLPRRICRRPLVENSRRGRRPEALRCAGRWHRESPSSRVSNVPDRAARSMVTTSPIRSGVRHTASASGSLGTMRPAPSRPPTADRPF